MSFQRPMIIPLFSRKHGTPMPNRAGHIYRDTADAIRCARRTESPTYRLVGLLHVKLKPTAEIL
jgi:hypothetical protein